MELTTIYCIGKRSNGLIRIWIYQLDEEGRDHIKTLDFIEKPKLEKYNLINYFYFK